MKNIKRLIFKQTIITVSAVAALLCACSPRSETAEIFAMDTYMTFRITGPDARAALQASIETVNGLDRLLAPRGDGSDVARINASAGQMADISPDTHELLEICKSWCEYTGGCFDITVGPAMSAYGFDIGDFAVPGDGELAALLPLIGPDGLLIEFPNRAGLAAPGMSITLGGAGKGYASDKIARLLSDYNIQSALISLGGNIVVIGKKPDGSPYRVGIRSPGGGASDAIGYIEARDEFIVTSGDYERYFEADGRRYHHILDPATLEPARGGIRSVTVVADSGTAADILSTALFVMGLEKGLEFYGERGGFEAVFIMDDNGVAVTPGLVGRFTLTDGDFHLMG